MLFRSVKHAHDLGDVGVPLAEATHLATHLVTRVVIQLVVARDRRLQDGGELSLHVALRLALAVGEDYLGRGLDVRLVIKPIAANVGLHLIEEVGVDLLGKRRLGVEALERLLNILGFVDEVEDVGVLLVRMDAVDAAERLDGALQAVTYDNFYRIPYVSGKKYDVQQFFSNTL